MKRRRKPKLVLRTPAVRPLWFGVQALACLGVCSAHPLFAADLAPVAKDGIAVRFVEAGEFRSSHIQGLELEIINATDQPANCDVSLVLVRDEAEVERTTRSGVSLPAHARQGFRVAEPRAYGVARVEYEVKINGAIFASGWFGFDASGPFHLSFRPYFLSRDAVLARLDILDPKQPPARYRFKLLDARRKRVRFETRDYRRIESADPNVFTPRTAVEALVKMPSGQAGQFVLEVEVLAMPEPGGLTNRTARLTLPLQQ